jgi:predicted nucleic acid-binding protein
VTTPWSKRLLPLRKVAFDTNVLVYGIEGADQRAALMRQAFRGMEAGLFVAAISAVVEMELLVKPYRDRNLTGIDRVERFLRLSPNLSILPVDRNVARRAADVRARMRLSAMDSIVVATAVEERADAIIGNDVLVANRVIGIPYILLDDFAATGG